MKLEIGVYNNKLNFACDTLPNWKTIFLRFLSHPERVGKELYDLMKILRFALYELNASECDVVCRGEARGEQKGEGFNKIKFNKIISFRPPFGKVRLTRADDRRDPKKVNCFINFPLREI